MLLVPHRFDSIHMPDIVDTVITRRLLDPVACTVRPPTVPAFDGSTTPFPVTSLFTTVTTSLPMRIATPAIVLAPTQRCVAGQWNVCTFTFGSSTSGNTPTPCRLHR